jgi:formylglycine-generating enzyme required for sulfatase activity
MWPVKEVVKTVKKPTARQSRAVTHQSFSAWLTRNPKWQRKAAIGAGKADSNYLSGWSGTTAPAGRARKAATNVSWYAAAAYCAGRGGLATLEQAPVKWKEGSAGASFEWRVSGKKAAYRESTGSTSLAVRKKESFDWTGFRCRR